MVFRGERELLGGVIEEEKAETDVRLQEFACRTGKRTAKEKLDCSFSFSKGL